MSHLIGTLASRQNDTCAEETTDIKKKNILPLSYNQPLLRRYFNLWLRFVISMTLFFFFFILYYCSSKNIFMSYLIL